MVTSPLMNRTAPSMTSTVALSGTMVLSSYSYGNVVTGLSLSGNAIIDPRYSQMGVTYNNL
jgi:hypothetical protein